MYSIDFAEHVWACGIESEYCQTPVLLAICELWDASYLAWVESYLPTEAEPVAIDF